MANEDLTAERADLEKIAKQLVFQINEIAPDQWDEWDDKDQARILAALRATRQEALREARQLVSTMFDQQASELPDYYAALLDVGNALDRLASEGG